MTMKQPKNTAKKHESGAKRKAKTAEMNRRINQEWAALDRFFAGGANGPRPETPTLNKLVALAVSDFEGRPPHDKRRLRLVWRSRGGQKITMRYMKTTFERFVLIPPTRYKYARAALELPRLKTGNMGGL